MKIITTCLIGVFGFSFANSQHAVQTKSWAELMTQLLDQYKIRVYYKPGIVPNGKITVELNENELVQSFTNAISPLGLAVILYDPFQWVIVKSEESNTSLEAWRTREAIGIKTDNLERSRRLKFITIGDPAQIANTKTIMLKGIIKEETSGQPSIGTIVETKDPTIGASTDIHGQYILEMPIGENHLTIKSQGMTTEEIDIILYSPGELNITLHNEPISLEEVVINERADDQNLKTVLMGVDQLALKEIKRLPSFMGELDIVKSLLSLPGVSTAGEGVGGLNIRGGNTDQNLILQDDIIYFNPSHALGFFSLFQPDMVEGVKLYKGNIPAKYGGRISSVLQTTSIVGDKQNWSVKGGAGLTSSHISTQGPLIKEKLSISIGARLSTINWLLDKVQVAEVQRSHVNFYDVQTKLNYWINNKSSIGIQLYNGDDDFRLGDDVQFSYKTSAVSAYYKSSLSANTFLNVRAVSGSYSSGLDDLLPADASLFQSGVDYLSIKSDLTIEASKDKIFNLGFEAIKYTVNPGSILPANGNSDVIPEILKDDHAIEAGVFADAQLSLTDRLTVSAGLRISGYSLLGEKDIRSYSTEKYFESASFLSSEHFNSGQWIHPSLGIEPRFSLNFELNSSSSFKASFNRTYQYLGQISNTVAATPIDFWKLSDNNIKPQSANTVSLGYYKNFLHNTWETSLEVYYRNIQNASDYRDFADLLAKENIETELLIGKGKNYGAELSIKKTIGKLTTRLGYTYSRSIKNMTFDKPGLSINQGQWYSSNYDKPHDFNLLLNLNPTQRYSFNFNFTFSSGRPISAPDGKYDDWNISGAPIYLSRNNYRLPDYHRLDISMNIFPGYKKNKRLKGSWTLGLYNVYSRKNAYSVYFRQQSVGKLRAYKLSVLGSVFPSITYNFEIK